MVDGLDRRTVLRGVSIGVTAGLAGCSDSGDSESPESDNSGVGSNGSNTTASESTSPTEPTETESSTSTQTSESTAGDVIHTGEEELEEYISTAGDPEDLPDDLSSYTTLGQSEYEWIEFEDIRNQVNFDFGDFENDDPAVLDERGTLDSVDTYYLALRESSEDYETIWAGLQVDEWDEDSSAIENYQNFYEGSPVDENAGNIEFLFSQNVSGYDDISDNFPQEYLSLIQE